jgi:L-aspartate semialdehyde sulfurtransferase ferredoxin
MAISKRIVLRFPKRVVERPIIYQLIKSYDLEFNILKASVTPDKEGVMVLEITGDRKNYDQGIQYLTETGVEMQALSQDITRNEDKCTSCGACLAVCPTDAFEVDPVTREVSFISEHCVACGECLKACPPHAMELHF